MDAGHVSHPRFCLFGGLYSLSSPCAFHAMSMQRRGFRASPSTTTAYFRTTPPSLLLPLPLRAGASGTF